MFNIKLQLITIKPLCASLLIEFYNHMSTETGKEKVERNWRAAGITDALKVCTKQQLSINSFDDLDPMVTAFEIT